MTAFVVVNPRAGRTARDWPKIQMALAAVFPGMTVAITKARGDAAKLVRAALSHGHLDIIAVGGDGTIHEAINGFFEHGAPLSPDAVFGFVSSGRRGNFCRTFGIKPGFEAGIARLAQSRVRRLDVGHVACVSATGDAVSRYFANAASFGMTGRLVAWGGGFVNHIFALIGWKTPRVRLLTGGAQDEITDEITGIANVVIANGRWFGGGLHIAPQAQPGDGFFDIVVMGGAPRYRLLRQMQALRNGTLAPNTRLVQAARLVAAPTVETSGRIFVEADGESVGLLPATFEIIPGAINLRC